MSSSHFYYRVALLLPQFLSGILFTLPGFSPYVPVYKELVNVYNSFTGWKVEKAHKSSNFSDWLEMADSNISTIVAFKYYAPEVFKLKWNC